MQFKKQGRRIYVLAYRGYDKVKRRAIVKMMGSMDANSYAPSDGLMENLTEEEKGELLSYIENDKQTKDRLNRQHNAMTVAGRISEVADAIRAGDFDPTAEWADGVWAAMASLGKALRKAGHPKPRRAGAATVPDGQAVLPMDSDSEC